MLVEIILCLGVIFVIIALFQSVLFGGLLGLLVVFAYDKFLIPWLATRIKLEGTVVHPSEQMLVLAYDADNWLWGHRMLGFQVGHNILRTQIELLQTESFQEEYKEMSGYDLSGTAIAANNLVDMSSVVNILAELPLEFDVVAGSAVESVTPLAFAVFFIPREKVEHEKVEIQQTDKGDVTVITKVFEAMPLEAHYGQNYDIWSLRQEIVLKGETVEDMGNIPFQVLAGSDRQGNPIIAVRDFPAYLLNFKRLATEQEKDAYLKCATMLAQVFPITQHAFRGIQYLSRERMINEELKKDAQSARVDAMHNAITLEKFKTDVAGTPMAGIWPRIKNRYKEQIPVSPVEAVKNNWALVVLIAIVASVLGYFLFPPVIGVLSGVIEWIKQWAATGGHWWPS